MKIKDILAKKGKDVITVQEDQSVAEAIKVLVENNIGAVLVRNSDGEISGLLSERDVLRQCHQNIDKLDDIQIKEVMTRDLIVGVPEDKAGYAEQIMVHNNIRHLPIVSDQRLEGIVSMRDIVQAELTDVKVENRYLRDYISNKYPA